MLFSNVWNSIPTKRLNLSKIVLIMQKNIYIQAFNTNDFPNVKRRYCAFKLAFLSTANVLQEYPREQYFTFFKKTFAFSLQNK